MACSNIHVSQDGASMLCKRHSDNSARAQTIQNHAESVDVVKKKVEQSSWLGAAREGLSHWHLLNGPHCCCTMVQVPDGAGAALTTGNKSSLPGVVAAFRRLDMHRIHGSSGR